MWDEATYANNAIDMFETPSLVVKTQGEIDLYNTKPPLVIGLQALSISIFGINTFAVRLPSIFFAFCSVFLLFFFAKKVFNSHWIGFISGMVLLSSLGFVRNHVALTGDLDSVLCFFLSASFLFGTYLILEDKKSKKHLLVFCMLLFAAFLTKGIAAFFHLPALICLGLIFNRSIFMRSSTYYAMLLLLLACTAYYVCREMLAPGYLEVVFNSEISRINTVVMDWQVRPFGFYLNNFAGGFFTPFLYLLPLGIIHFIRSNKSQKYAVSLLIGITAYFLIISIPKVKLDWYDAPLYPLMALFVGMTISQYCLLLARYWQQATAQILIIVSLCTFNMVTLFQQMQKPQTQVEALEREGHFLDKLPEFMPEIKKVTVWKKEASSEHYDQVLFYKRALEKEKGYEVSLTQEGKFIEGEKVIISQPNLIDALKNNYKSKVIHSNPSTQTYLFEILGPK